MSNLKKKKSILSTRVLGGLVAVTSTLPLASNPLVLVALGEGWEGAGAVREFSPKTHSLPAGTAHLALPSTQLYTRSQLPALLACG